MVSTIRTILYLVGDLTLSNYYAAKLLRRRFIPVKIVRHRRRDNFVSVR
jgi:hypothetical protein